MTAKTAEESLAEELSELTADDLSFPRTVAANILAALAAAGFAVVRRADIEHELMELEVLAALAAARRG